VFDVVFPHLEKVLVEHIGVEGGTVRISARTREGVAVACPGCGVLSARVHSRYERHVADTAVGGRPVVVDLTVRRLFCDQAGCPRRTFVEQVEGLTIRYGRYTPLLLGVLQAVGLALAGRAGARLLTVLHAVVSRVTLLALVMALPDPAAWTVTIVGVDDFAFRRGHHYGTVLVDAESHRPLELLAGREAEPFAAWLRDRPEIQVICRDRATAYAKAAARAAPQAAQVADRWHLWHNLGQHVEKDVAAHRRCLGHRAGPGPPDPAAIETLPAQALSAQGVLEARTRKRFRDVHELAEQGWAIAEIARELHLNYKTARLFARAQRVEDLLGHIAGARPSILDPWREYLLARWSQGCHSATALHAELAERGLVCSFRTLSRYLRTLTVRGELTTATVAPPKTRTLVGWLMRPDAVLTDDEYRGLKQALDDCPDLARLHEHVASFADVLTHRPSNGGLLKWVEAARTDTLPALRTFAAGLDKDWDAVLGAVTSSWSSGVVEGTVTKIKLVKRQMYGRAGLPLLRKRVLLL
jgi:transposase